MKAEHGARRAQLRILGFVRRPLVVGVLGGLAFAMPSAGQSPAEDESPRKEVLVLYGLQSFMPVVGDWDRGIRSAIESMIEGPVRIDREFLDLLRSQDDEYRSQWVAVLRAKYAHADPAVILAVHDAAVSFVLAHRDELFPGVPVVFCAEHFQASTGGDRPADVTGAAYALSYEATLDLALKLRPDTRRVVVVSGASSFGQFILEGAKDTFAGRHDLEFEYLAGLPVSELLRRLAGLPDDAIVLFLIYLIDSSGRAHHANDVLAEVSRVAPVPTFALWDTNLGTGTVGGHVVRSEMQGRLAGEIAARIIRGEEPATIPVVGLGTNQFVVDWRGLQRWGISEADLPSESRILHREPSVWDEYGAYILAAAAAFIIQSCLILGLVVSRIRRGRAERALIASREESRQLAGRLLSAQEDGDRRIARELHDDLSQRLAAAAIEAGRLAVELGEPQATHPGLALIRGHLTTLADDVHRISRRLHPSILDDLGLEDALRSECSGLAEHASIVVDFTSRGEFRTLPRAVVLCVYRIAQEAMRNALKHAACDRIEVEIERDDDSVFLRVEDHGRGFDAASCAHRPGVGLASMKERAHLVCGVLNVSSYLGRGTLIEARIPTHGNTR